MKSTKTNDPKVWVRNVNKAIDQLEQSILTRFKYVCYMVSYEAGNSTPVDTGRLRSNWIASKNMPSTTFSRIDFPKGRRGSTATSAMEFHNKQAVRVIRSLKINDTFYLTNNVVYGYFVNSGGPKNTPRAMTTKALMAGFEAVRASNISVKFQAYVGLDT